MPTPLTDADKVLRNDTGKDIVTALNSIAAGLNTPPAEDVQYDNTDSGLSATNVQDAIDEVQQNIDDLPEPMVFKGSLGTGGTITALPVDGTANIGDTYKVITAGTYAGQAAKIGDTFICDSKTSFANTWTLIPSGDEPSGTVTSVTIQATSPIVVDNSSAITTSGTRTLSHADSGAPAGSYGDSSAQTPDYGETFKVPTATVDAKGHVTAISEHTVKMPEAEMADSPVVNNKTPYAIRQTPSNIGNLCLEKLIGVSCAFNQLVNLSNGTKTAGGVTFTITDNRIVGSGTATAFEEEIQNSRF